MDTRTVLDDPTQADTVLAAHRDRLERERARLSASLGDTVRFADGLPAVSPSPSAARAGQAARTRRRRRGGLLAAGATELLGPHETEGMPRSSAVRDPDANVVWLYQG